MREVCSLLYLWLLKVEWSNMKISLLPHEQQGFKVIFEVRKLSHSATYFSNKDERPP